MAELEDDMDDLFRQAAENYRLKEPSDDWDGIAGRLTGAVPDSMPVSDKPWALLLLLLFMLPVCGYLAHLIITNYKQQTLYTTVNHNPSPSTRTSVPGAQPIQKTNKTVNNTSTLIVPAPAQSDQQASSMPVGDGVQRSGTTTGQRTVASTVQRSSSNLRKQDKVKAAVSGPSLVKTSSSQKAREQIFPSSTKDTHPQTDHLNDDTAVANGEMKKRLQEPEVTTNNDVLPELTTKDTLKQTAKADTLKEVKDTTVPRKKAVDQRPQKGLLLGIAAGPEWNQVQRQRYTKMGYDIGIIAGYQFNNKVSLEASAFLARKYYYSSGKYFNLKMPGMDVVSLQGSSTIIEVPLKLKYNFLHKQPYSLFASAGLISYFLTDEKNDYILLVNGGETNMTGKYPDASRYFAAAVDVSVGYQHYFGRLTSMRIEPYVQLPLKGIGVGSMQVMSSGIHLVFTRLMR